MKNPFRTPEFKKTQAEYYKKLKDSGFDDAEKDENYLKEWHSHYFQSRNNKDTFESKQEYFSQAEQFLNIFKTLKIIWAMHTEGQSYREITASMERKGIKCNKDKVNLIINNLKGIMKVHINGEDFESRRTENRRHHNGEAISAHGFQLSLFDMA